VCVRARARARVCVCVCVCVSALYLFLEESDTNDDVEQVERFTAMQFFLVREN